MKLSPGRLLWNFGENVFYENLAVAVVKVFYGKLPAKFVMSQLRTIDASNKLLASPMRRTKLLVMDCCEVVSEVNSWQNYVKNVVQSSHSIYQCEKYALRWGLLFFFSNNETRPVPIRFVHTIYCMSNTSVSEQNNCKNIIACVCLFRLHFSAPNPFAIAFDALCYLLRLLKTPRNNSIERTLSHKF